MRRTGPGVFWIWIVLFIVAIIWFCGWGWGGYGGWWWGRSTGTHYSRPINGGAAGAATAPGNSGNASTGQQAPATTPGANSHH